jgi:DNA-binding transcriptional ArsR family regulator
MPVTSPDPFHALAEPRRREILVLLARHGALAVGALVLAMGLPQPAVSKHLAVLREAGLVAVEKQGQHRVYSLNAAQLKAVHDWTATFERYWTHQLGRLKRLAEEPAPQLESEDPAAGPDHPDA